MKTKRIGVLYDQRNQVIMLVAEKVRRSHPLLSDPIFTGIGSIISNELQYAMENRK